ncbi:MAG: efflux RND transporter periplasmic adaptor subunit [Ignavibacteria bacterium]|jgi:RND family efflux transporter MFP subunit|nr:efflux RND transporter periplasmic adaptor subunit [Ignavibacteria bacterium]MCU7502002.1 efflux RND transporter periplasmic adaptor subunit [Ignavibacteria bacterium]MCU7516970.1 efflux RND transporter periplasmic adaptor subunit [Ignavibacteria bacterium]
MKNKFRFLWGTAVLIIASSLALTSCGRKNAEAENRSGAGKEKSDSVSVIAAKVETINMSLKKTYTGTLEGDQQANIVSQLAERIISIPVKVGENVRAGQVIVKLDKGGVISQYFQAQTSMQNAEKTLERNKALFESGAIARQALDQAQMAYDIARANFNAARNAVEITTPISGVVTSIKLNIGDFTSPGTPIVTVATINSLKLIMSVGEADIPYVATGKNVKIYSELNPDIVANGKITEISKSADLSTRTFQIKAAFSNVKGSWFKPGMFAKAELDLSTQKEVSVIPREAVIYAEKGPQVFVISQGKAYSRDVKLGLQNDKYIEVVEGLKPDEVVARVGMNNLKDGMPVVVSTDPKLLSQS